MPRGVRPDNDVRGRECGQRKWKEVYVPPYLCTSTLQWYLPSGTPPANLEDRVRTVGATSTVESQGAQGTSVGCWGSSVVDWSEPWNDREQGRPGLGCPGCVHEPRTSALQLGVLVGCDFSAGLPLVVLWSQTS